MRWPETDKRAKREPAPRQNVADDHSHRRSFAERTIDRKLALETWDGKSFRNLRTALAMKSSDRRRP
jgi:hypothetical protein